jgi:SAM-dependent methyltransferase
VVAVDIQPRMLSGLRRRLARRGLLERVEIRSAKPDSLNVSDLAGKVDLVVAFAVIHELPDATAFFAESCHVMKSGASLLIAEPRGHVDVTLFAAELDSAARHGLVLAERPAISRSHAAILRKA